MRLFVAVEIAPDIRERLTHFMAERKLEMPNARFVRPEGLHVTLKFLGEVAETKLASLTTALAEIHEDSFSLTLRGTGFFPNQKRPRIFWVGLHSDPEAALSNLAASVDHACAQLGFAPEERPYQPHVTLARLSNSRASPRITDESFGMMWATHFHLYQSQLHPKGAIYTKLASFTLAHT